MSPLKAKIIKQSHILGLITFTWEVKLKLYSSIYPLLKPIGYIVGKINNYQMVVHSILIKK